MSQGQPVLGKPAAQKNVGAERHRSGLAKISGIGSYQIYLRLPKPLDYHRIIENPRLFVDNLVSRAQVGDAGGSKAAFSLVHADIFCERKR
jgi:hypothetical protein